ncbi:hypothetical protein DM02DRAFT_612616 [Periconia macrospinosa]|uniref:F-box domain-containing protein n=1 Tax=Periconia macrospinosa TaxID=97972 RepID=A0A2V1DXB5_9PLEO|nr:hypothetical protein DM02DRAFT_612616 [Periconia macrospinosa]
MTELLDLCYDVLIRILEEVDAGDLASCAQTSWSFYRFIQNNARLFKHHYLKNFDDPRRKAADAEPEWILELQKVVRLQKVMESGNLDVKSENFAFVHEMTESLISTASLENNQSRNVAELSRLITIPGNTDAFLSKSSLYARGGTSTQKAASTEEQRQLSAKLHCYYGIPDTPAGRRTLSTHPYARSRVYDLRHYTTQNGWGPYLSDGSMRVDWEMIEALMVDVAYNSGMCCRRLLTRFRLPWSEPFEGIVHEPNANEPKHPLGIPKQIDAPLDSRDPYGVSGIWSRIVCFLDYTDLYNLNFSTEALLLPLTEPRAPISTEEAIRHILMRLRVVRIEEPDEDSHPSYPVVYFQGTSYAVHASWDPNASSRIRGSVRMTKHGDVRWNTVSVFHGEERWASDGIQVGGVRSSRGVIGTWFDKDFDEHGPAGPTVFWKLCDGHDDDELDSDEEEFAFYSEN